MSDNSANNHPHPTTPEAAAFRLFELIRQNKPENLKQEAILPLFAKCMWAVKDSKDFLEKSDPKIGHLQPFPTGQVEEDYEVLTGS